MKEKNMSEKQKKIDNMMKELGKKYPTVLALWEEQKKNIKKHNTVVATYKTVKSIWN